ncbi:MAG: YdcF family protein, partial [Alphaproteobacteria bacterium]
MGGTIFFVASKVLGLLIRPETWLFLALLVALRRVARGDGASARRWLGGAALAVLALGAWPLGDLVLAPLEARYPPRPALARVDGIIVLSGAEEAELSRRWGMPEVNGASERLLAGLALARRFPE